MRELMNLVEAAVATFRLHPALNPDNYVMTDSLGDYERWEAMTYLANSTDSGPSPKGKLKPVGYIMISLKDDTIIPISRNDEHNKGFDLMYELEKKTKGAINADDFLPIWSYGNNYIYSKEEAPELLIALTKFLSYGGPNGVLKGTSGMRGLAMSSKQFIAAGGEYEAKKHELSPLGAEVYADLQALSTAIQKASVSDSRSLTGAAFQVAGVLLKLLARDRLLEKGIDFKAIEALKPQLRDLQKAGDLRGLEEMFFGFNGVKNVIHNSLRAALKDKTSWDSEELQSIWGDLDLAVDMLGRL